MKHKKGGILMLGGLLLVAAALSLTAYNVWEEQRASASAKDTVMKLDGLIFEKKAALAQPTDRIPDDILDPEREMPTIQIDGHDYIGTVTIPELELSLPVMSQWSYPDLKLSPCRFSGSAYRNDLIIAGHNYARHFGGLKNLTVGDEVLFTDADGTVFSYAVSEMEQLGPNDVEELEAGDWALTLFTCTIGGQYRVTVRCEAANAADDVHSGV